MAGVEGVINAAAIAETALHKLAAKKLKRGGRQTEGGGGGDGGDDIESDAAIEEERVGGGGEVGDGGDEGGDGGDEGGDDGDTAAGAEQTSTHADASPPPGAPAPSRVERAPSQGVMKALELGGAAAALTGSGKFVPRHVRQALELLDKSPESLGSVSPEVVREAMTLVAPAEAAQMMMDAERPAAVASILEGMIGGGGGKNGDESGGDESGGGGFLNDFEDVAGDILSAMPAEATLEVMLELGKLDAIVEEDEEAEEEGEDEEGEEGEERAAEENPEESVKDNAAADAAKANDTKNGGKSLSGVRKVVNATVLMTSTAQAAMVEMAAAEQPQFLADMFAAADDAELAKIIDGVVEGASSEGAAETAVLEVLRGSKMKPPEAARVVGWVVQVGALS